MHDESTPSNRLRSPALQRRSLKLLPLKLAGTYFVVAVLWILLADFWLATFVTSPVALIHLQSIEDLLFVSLTAGALYWLTQRSLRTLQQTETTLRESEERLRLILQNMPVMLDAFDDQGNIIIWNQECERVTGYHPEELIGNPQAMTLLYPDVTYRQQMSAAWAERGNDYRNWEWDLVCKDGSHRTVAWSNLSDRFPIPGWMSWSIGVDMTDRKRSEEALRESEAQFRSLSACSPVGIYLASPEGYSTYTNPRCQEIFGFTLSESMGDGWAERVHPDDREWLFQTWAAAAAAGQSFTADYRVTPRDAVRWVQTRTAPMRSNEGTLIGHAGTIEDITARKQAEAQIRQLNQTLAQQNHELEALVEQRTAELITFINTLPDDIFVVDRQMRFLFCNDQNAHFSGFATRQQVEGKTIFELFSPDQAQAFAAQNQQVFDSGEMLHFQAAYDRPQGTLHLDIYKIPLKHSSGEVYALIGAARDVTELVEVRQKIADRTAQLEMVNRELESFSYSVSHDLRAPLRHMGGFVTALTERLQQDGHLTDPTVAHYLQIIQDSSYKMGALIDGLLTLSRVGRRQIADTRVDLNQLVTAVLAQRPEVTTASTTEAVGNTQLVQFSVGALPTVKGDATLLQQVFVNLLDNAIKFSRHHQPAYIEIGALSDGIIFVRDRGVGFQTKYADQLFGAFQRLHSQSEFEGSGIGLAIVQRIIHRHGGNIWAESQPDQGATFYFTLGDRLEQSGQAH